VQCSSHFSAANGLHHERFELRVCLIYLDDIILFAPDVATHLKRLEVVLDCLRKASLKLKAKQVLVSTKER